MRGFGTEDIGVSDQVWDSRIEVSGHTDTNTHTHTDTHTHCALNTILGAQRNPRSKSSLFGSKLTQILY